MKPKRTHYAPAPCGITRPYHGRRRGLPNLTRDLAEVTCPFCRHQAKVADRERRLADQTLQQLAELTARRPADLAELPFSLTGQAAEDQARQLELSQAADDQAGQAAADDADDDQEHRDAWDGYDPYDEEG